MSVRELVTRAIPRPLLPSALAAVRKGRGLRCRVDMLLFPREMVGYCPCCGMRFRAFVAGPFKGQPQRFNPARYEHTRQDVLCPVCKSMPRHRILSLWCEENVGLLRSAKILYFAPEYGLMLWMRRNGVSCVTADLNGGADLRLDIQDTGLPDGSFDVVVCNHVFEHVDDFRVALRDGAKIRELREKNCLTVRGGG